MAEVPALARGTGLGGPGDVADDPLRRLPRQAVSQLPYPELVDDGVYFDGGDPDPRSQRSRRKPGLRALGPKYVATSAIDASIAASIAASRGSGSAGSAGLATPPDDAGPVSYVVCWGGSSAASPGTDGVLETAADVAGVREDAGSARRRRRDDRGRSRRSERSRRGLRSYPRRSRPRSGWVRSPRRQRRPTTAPRSVARSRPLASPALTERRPPGCLRRSPTRPRPSAHLGARLWTAGRLRRTWTAACPEGRPRHSKAESVSTLRGRAPAQRSRLRRTSDAPSRSRGRRGSSGRTCRTGSSRWLPRAVRRPRRAARRRPRPARGACPPDRHANLFESSPSPSGYSAIGDIGIAAVRPLNIIRPVAAGRLLAGLRARGLSPGPETAYASPSRARTRRRRAALQSAPPGAAP